MLHSQAVPPGQICFPLWVTRGTCDVPRRAPFPCVAMFPAGSGLVPSYYPFAGHASLICERAEVASMALLYRYLATVLPPLFARTAPPSVKKVCERERESAAPIWFAQLYHARRSSRAIAGVASSAAPPVWRHPPPSLAGSSFLTGFEEE